MHLMERLMKGKDEPNSLTAAEKLELWDRLKILSMDMCTNIACFNISIMLLAYDVVSCAYPDFTRIVLSLWATTMVSLYIRVQVNILGRHLYIDTARGLGSSIQLVRTASFYLT